MTDEKYILTNIAYGTGPYIRITELATAVNDRLEQQGESRYRIVLPLLYGEKQKRILREEFGESLVNESDEIILDETLGDYYEPILYANEPFKKYLTRWATDGRRWSKRVSEYLEKTYGASNSIELARAPRLNYDISPAYFTSFDFLSNMFSCSVGADSIAVDDQLLREAGEQYTRLERTYAKRYISEPETLNYDKQADGAGVTATLVPPLSRPPRDSPKKLNEEAIYVTVSGISGLDTLYEQGTELGYDVYTNDPATIGGGQESLPWLVASDNIKWHFARPGWGSVWLSIFTETPLLLPPWDPTDDPEIYHNALRLKELGIARTYTGEPFDELAVFRERAVQRMRALKSDIKSRHGTLDGISIVAKDISRHLLNRGADAK